MAMVQIVRGSQHLEVTSGAFRTIFEPSGWALQSDVTAGAPAEQETEFPPIGGTIQVNGENDAGDNSADEDEDTDESDENDAGDSDQLNDEELTEKPLAEMSLEELKRYAAIMEIDITGNKSKKEIRATIRAAM